MNTKKHCSLRTLGLGLWDWISSRTAMTQREALLEIHQQNGKHIPLKLAGLVLFIVLLLLVLSVSAPAVIKKSIALGATSQGFLNVSLWGSVLGISASAGFLVVSWSMRLVLFCQLMCERGHALENARTLKQS